MYKPWLSVEQPRLEDWRLLPPVTQSSPLPHPAAPFESVVRPPAMPFPSLPTKFLKFYNFYAVTTGNPKISTHISGTYSTYNKQIRTCGMRQRKYYIRIHMTVTQDNE